MTRATYLQLGGANRRAFLDAIAWSEIGAALLHLPESDDGYDVLVGDTPELSRTFQSYDDHPNILNKRLDSTAAGRYQIIHPTWVTVSARLSLTDFSPINQDRAALYLAQGRGALPAIDAGRLTSALLLCAPEWASLPTSTAGQHTNTLAAVTEAYTAAGGTLA